MSVHSFTCVLTVLLPKKIARRALKKDERLSIIIDMHGMKLNKSEAMTGPALTLYPLDEAPNCLNVVPLSPADPA